MSHLMTHFCSSYDFQGGRKERLGSFMRRPEVKNSPHFPCYIDLNREFSPAFCMNKERSYCRASYYLITILLLPLEVVCGAFKYSALFFFFR